MRYVRMLGLCLVAVFAIGAITAAGASAFKPEWGKCIAQANGRYKDAGCTEKAHGKGNPKVYEGSYEWEQRSGSFGAEVIESTNITFETQAGHKIQCTEVEYEDPVALLGPYGSNTPLWILEGCESEGQPCTTLSIGSASGIVSNRLAWLEQEGRRWTGELGAVEGQGTPTPVVGLSFNADNTISGERESFFTPISCEGSLGTVLMGGDKERPHGLGNNSFIGVIEPVNKTTKEFTLTYSESAPGIQAPGRFGRRKQQYLQAFVHNTWEPVAIMGTITYESSKAEIKATK
jgi:hypothetical protein